MHIDINYMRGFIKNRYPGYKFSKKVDRMPYAQVAAIYFRLLESDKKEEHFDGVQITLFETYPDQMCGWSIYKKDGGCIGT